MDDAALLSILFSPRHVFSLASRAWARARDQEK